MLRLPVPAGVRRAARRRRGLRGPRPEDPRRRPEPPVRRRLADRLRRLAPGRRVPGQQPQRRRRVRLRLLVPRRRRRAGLGGLAAALLLASCGGVREAPKPAPVPRFAIGIDEKNPHLLAPGDQPAPFARFRDALVALKPAYVRVLADWSTMQKAAGSPPDFAERKDG